MEVTPRQDVGLRVYEVDQARVEIRITSGLTPTSADRHGADAELEVGVWTDVSGIVLFEWQVRAATEEEWQLPPPPHPPDSGVNGKALQTMLVPQSQRPGQGLQLRLRPPIDAVRWQLFCIGPPTRRVPDEMQDLPCGCGRKSAASLGLGSAGLRPDTRSCYDSSDSDEDCGGAIVKLQLAGGSGQSQRAVLGQRTLDALIRAAEIALPSEADRLRDGLEAFGLSAGLTMRLDSDAAVDLFLSSASQDSVGAPTVELRAKALAG
eukprot:gnl/TRDRNA2_/TRDRNA2_188191_c0_seq1.p1 gnl/TRDRNA2_/TRDRNA2_188191_c0~~gnl/TRDRNA2_/TRDRNA2_188191_c0_seq1.p1  ORF type:complete len:264 (-),score=50.88 gnl/TRDRNA2_/TRDRNA2_188191_c0_seq1:30-821(-)